MAPKETNAVKGLENGSRQLIPSLCRSCMAILTIWLASFVSRMVSKCMLMLAFVSSLGDQNIPHRTIRLCSSHEDMMVCIPMGLSIVHFSCHNGAQCSKTRATWRSASMVQRPFTKCVLLTRLSQTLWSQKSSSRKCPHKAQA